MTPEELDEAIEIARKTGGDAIYSRRVLARAVLFMADRHDRLNRYINDLGRSPSARVTNPQGNTDELSG